MILVCWEHKLIVSSLLPAQLNGEQSDGVTVLKNPLHLRDQAALDAFEALITDQRAAEPLPTGRFRYAHYRAIHHHLFQDVFTWAGKPRTVRISKDGSTFCYPENIQGQMALLFEQLRRARFLTGLHADEFAVRAAHMLAELNAIHCFREGNCRAQLTYFTFAGGLGWASSVT